MFRSCIRTNTNINKWCNSTKNHRRQVVEGTISFSVYYYVKKSDFTSEMNVFTLIFQKVLLFTLLLFLNHDNCECCVPVFVRKFEFKLKTVCHFSFSKAHDDIFRGMDVD